MKTFRQFCARLVLVALCSIPLPAQPTQVSGGDSLPSQTGNSGKFLKTDGSTAAWDTPAGAGDVVGPASATDGVPALFDTTTGKLLKNSTPTGTGNPVLANSPALITPDLGVPTAVDLTNAAGLPTGGMVNAAVTLAKMANLAQDQFIGRTTASTGVPETATITAAARTVLDDTSVADMVNTLGGASSTGTGGLVRSGSPTLDLANATALPAAQVVAGALADGMTATTQTVGDNDTSLATTAFANAAAKATRLGSHASPDTSAGSITWATSAVYEVWSNTTSTYSLPAASGYDGKAVIFYVTGTNALTIDPNSSEVIVRDGTAQTGGVTLTLTGAAGNYVCLVCDGTRWITLGYKGTLAAGS